MYTKLIIDEPPLQVLPKLAAAIGLNEAITLQQIHWLLLTYGKEREGRLWIYNTYEDWKANQFPFWSTNTIRRVLSNLEEGGYVLTGVFNRSPIDNTKWYSIDYDAVSALVNRLGKSADDLPKMGRPLAQNEQITPAQNGQTNTNRKREQKEENTPSAQNENPKTEQPPAIPWQRQPSKRESVFLHLNARCPAAQRRPLVDALIAVHGLQALIDSDSPDADRKLNEMHELACVLHEMKMGVKDIERFAKLWTEKDFRGQKKQRPQNGQFLTFISQQLADTSGFPAEDPGEKPAYTITDSWDA